MEFRFPKLKYGDNPVAVYKITFDTGHFYIGSSCHVKTRFNTWRTSLKHGRLNNRLLIDILPSVKLVYFEILKRATIEDVLMTEDIYLKENKTNPLSLNRCADALENKGRNPLPKHLTKPKKIQIPKPYVKKENPIDQRKKVYQFSLGGEFIKEYNSILAACEFAGVCNRTMNKHFKIKFIRKSRVKGIKGHIYRLVNSFPIYPQKQIEDKRLRNLYSKKVVIDINTGVFYINAKELAKLYGYKEKCLYRILSGERTNKTTFQYA